MNLSRTFRSVINPGGLAKLLFFAGLCWPVVSTAQVEEGVWRTNAAQLPVFFPKPTAVSGSPELLIVPLLGPQRWLLPGGKLLIWVGRSDGTALANTSVIVEVPSPGNALVNDGSRVTLVTVLTDANGIAQVFLTAPDIAPVDNNEGGGEPPAA